MRLDLLSANLKALAASRDGGVHALPFEKLVEFLEKHLDGLSVSRGTDQWNTTFTAQDMAWNRMDFAHRPYVHHQYEMGLRIALSKDVGLDCTQLANKLLLIPIKDERRLLREAGYAFRDNNPEFLEASKVYPTNIVSPAAPSITLAVSELPLETAGTCDGFRACPWHGLRVASAVVSDTRPRAELSSVAVTLTGGQVTITPKTNREA